MKLSQQETIISQEISNESTLYHEVNSVCTLQNGHHNFEGPHDSRRHDLFKYKQTSYKHFLNLSLNSFIGPNISEKIPP